MIWIFKEWLAMRRERAAQRICPHSYWEESIEPHPKDMHECMVRLRVCTGCGAILNPEVLR